MDKLVIQILLSVLFFLYPVWRVFKRAGLHPAYSFFVILPVFGLLITGIILSASTWKVSQSKGGS